MSWIICAFTLAAFLFQPSVQARRLSIDQEAESLQGLSSRIEALAEKASPAVVQVFVWGYGNIDGNGTSEAGLIGKQSREGSGVIVDSDGYIMTNAHLVQHAKRIRVMVRTAPSGLTSRIWETLKTNSRMFDATVVGIDELTDLALLKIEATKQRQLPFGDYQELRQGQLVVAIGNPLGLQHSVTLGVVSSVARQINPDDPRIYIQTDAAINPGNSGGPLLDMKGNLVGINTFVITEEESQGLGFAIPSEVVLFVYRHLRSYGRVRRGQIGAYMQSITPSVAAGLELPINWGVIVSDVLPGGPAEMAGLKIKDIVLTLDGKAMESLPEFAAAIFVHEPGDEIHLSVLRGEHEKNLNIVLKERAARSDHLSDLVDPRRDLIPRLGVVGLQIDEQIAAMFPKLREKRGVLVVGRAAQLEIETELSSGDVIHSVNTTPVVSVQQLRSMLRQLSPGDPVVMQIERDGSLMFFDFGL